MVTFEHLVRPLPQRRLVWLLWLALLLPAAQLVAACHALSHLAAAADVARGDSHALHLLHCDLCVSAAAVAGGAPLAAPSAWQAPALAAQAAPSAAIGGVIATLPQRAYLSRAPPFAQA